MPLDWDTINAAAAPQQPVGLDWNAINAQVAQTPTSPAAPAAPQVETGPLAWAKRQLYAANQGVADTWNAAAQLAEHSIPGLTALDRAFGTPTADQVAASSEAAYGAKRAQLGGSGTDWTRDITRGATTMPLAAVAPEASPWLMGPALGAASGALTPVTKTGTNLSDVITGQQGVPDYWSQVAKNTGVGAVSGLAGPVISKFIAPPITAGARQLLDAGVRLTPGQMLGGAAGRIEQAATSVPLLGDVIKNAQRQSWSDLNNMVVNRALAPIGEELPSTVTGRAAISTASNKISAAYDDVIDKIGAAPIDGQLLNDLRSLQAMTQTLPKGMGDQFSNIVQKEIMGRVNIPPGTQGALPTMTGEGLKAAESNLGQIARGYARSSDYDQQQLGTAVSEAQNTIRDWLARVAPDQADRLRSINTAYSLLQRPQRAASYLGSEDGIFNADQLQSAVRALDTSKNKAAFARGNAVMQDVSDTAKSVLGNKVPDSGTPLRSGAMALGGLAIGHAYLPPGVAPIAAGAAGAATLPYLGPGASITRWLMSAAPAQRAAIGNALVRSNLAGPVIPAMLANQGLNP